MFYINTGWFSQITGSPKVDSYWYRYSGLAVPETTPLSLFQLVAKFLYGARLCISFKEGGGYSEFQHFIKTTKMFPEMPSAVSVWPEWNHRAGLSAKEAGKVGNRIEWMRTIMIHRLGTGMELRFTYQKRRGDAQLYFFNPPEYKASPLVSLVAYCPKLHIFPFALFTWNIFAPLRSTCQILHPSWLSS